MATEMAVRLDPKYSLREFLGVSWEGWLLGVAWNAISATIPLSDEGLSRYVDPDGDRAIMLPEQLAILSRYSTEQIAEAAKVVAHLGSSDLECHMPRRGNGCSVIAPVLNAQYHLNQMDPDCGNTAVGETRIKSLVRKYCEAEGFADTAHMAVAVSWAG